jgi:hypothetical protein
MLRQDTAPQRRDDKDWLPAAELLAMILTLAAMGGWFYVRERREPPPVTEMAVAEVPVPPTRPIAFTCDGCGKGLKARAALAGKKVKCPQCSRTLTIPSLQAAAPPEKPRRGGKGSESG